MNEKDKALDKIDIASELKTLSPIQKKSIELRIQAQAVEITDKTTLATAKKIRKALVGHRTSTKDLRLTFTRKLDNLKDQFIKKQDEVLEDSLRGEEIVKEKIAAWEKAEQERKDAEEARIKAITDKIYDVTPMTWRLASLEDVKRERARLKMERGLLEPNDRNRVLIKSAFDKVNESLDELEEKVKDRIEQERVAEEQRKEQERLDAERKKLEEEKAAQEAANFATNAALDKQNLERSATVVDSDASLKKNYNDSMGKLFGVEDEVPTPTTPPSEDTLEPKSETATWELVCHGRWDPSEEQLKKIAAKIYNGENIGEYIVEEPEE